MMLIGVRPFRLFGLETLFVTNLVPSWLAHSLFVGFGQKVASPEAKFLAGLRIDIGCRPLLAGGPLLFRSTGGNTLKHPLDAQVFINVGPVQSLTISLQTSLLREPRQSIRTTRHDR